MTNIQITSDPTYFNHVINGAKVFKPSHQNNVPGRAILAVPRDIENMLVLTLTWIGAEHNLRMIAETAMKSDSNCMLGFFNPKCIGMLHLGSTDDTVNGETITIHPEAFLDSKGKFIADRRILIYVTNASDDSDITQSSA